MADALYTVTLTEADLRAAVVAEARQWIGTPWRHQGSHKGQRCDCVGLVTGVARVLAIADVQVRGYARQPTDDSMRALCAQHMPELPVHQAQAGDCVLIRFDEWPQHVGILGDYPLGGLSLIHADSKHGRVVEVRLDDIWRSRCVAAFSIVGAGVRALEATEQGGEVAA